MLVKKTFLLILGKILMLSLSAFMNISGTQAATVCTNNATYSNVAHV